MDDVEIEHALRSTQAAKRLTERQPLVDDVYGVLIDLLMNHDIEAGQRLNIDALSRSIGVSPTPIREALARMEVEALVVKEPRRGYTVAPLIGHDALRQLIDFRLLVEPAGAAEAARRATPDERSALQAFARSGGAGDNDSAANRLDMIYDATFHDTIAALSGNHWLRDSLLRLRSHMHMYRLYHHAHQAAATKPEHTDIADAIAAGDPDAASAAMRAHLETAMTRLDRVLTMTEAPIHGRRAAAS